MPRRRPEKSESDGQKSVVAGHFPPTIGSISLFPPGKKESRPRFFRTDGFSLNFSGEDRSPVRFGKCYPVRTAFLLETTASRSKEAFLARSNGFAVKIGVSRSEQLFHGSDKHFPVNGFAVRIGVSRSKEPMTGRKPLLSRDTRRDSYRPRSRSRGTYPQANFRPPSREPPSP